MTDQYRITDKQLKKYVAEYNAAYPKTQDSPKSVRSEKPKQNWFIRLFSRKKRAT